MISRDTAVVGVGPRITQETFTAILGAVSSPALIEADLSYKAIVAEGIDPAFCLAQFHVESSYGTIGICHDYSTCNPGNCRSSSIGVINSITDPEKGEFVKYSYWRLGFKDMAHRLVDSRFPYAQAKARTIAQILPIWAPGADGNSPNSYVNTVISLMNRWIGEGKMKDPTTRTRLIPGHAGRGRGGGNPLVMTMHVQEGMNDLYPEFLNRPPGKEADCTIWSKQDGTLDRLLLDTDTPWTNGDIVAPDMSNPIIAGLVKKGVTNSNRYALTIEHQGFASQGFTDAQLEATAQMIAYWCSLYGWTPSRTNVIGHYQVGNHKNCPGPKFPFDRVIARAKEILGNTGNVPQGDTTKLNGYSLGGGFKAFYDRLAAAGPNLELLTLGYPVTNEFDCPLDGKTNTVQLFQRGGLIYEAANSQPWDVHSLTTSQLVQALEVAKSKSLLN